VNEDEKADKPSGDRGWAAGLRYPQNAPPDGGAGLRSSQQPTPVGPSTFLGNPQRLAARWVNSS